MFAGVLPRAIWRGRPYILSKRSADRTPATPPAARPPPTPESPTQVEQDDAELEELNESLALLTELFPDVRPEVFREMLASFSRESRLQVIVETLLQDRPRYVRNRIRVLRLDTDREVPRCSLDMEALPKRETFRSEEYKAAVKAAFYQEFRGIAHSTIKAILAEHNHSYVHARRALADLTSRSWRFSVFSLFSRRRIAPQTPLIDWEAPEGPWLRPTLSNELNDELKQAFVIPMQRQKTENKLAQDKRLAEQINEEEAEAAQATFDCSVCFTPATFENISSCTGLDGHFICARCIRLTAKEALFGQGWSQSIDSALGSLKCVSPEGQGQCKGGLPRESVERALNAEPESAGFWRKLETRIAQENLRGAGLQLATCPFCAYAEVIDEQPPDPERFLQLLRSTFPYSIIMILSFITLLYRPMDIPRIIWLVFQAFAISVIMLWAESPKYPFLSFTFPYKHAAQRPNSGRKFVCGNPDCQRTSCMSCQAAWRDIHSCHQSSRQSLRAHVEAAISDAIKRTCPSCNLSFVKATGCNKLVCVCGYAMCYICRSHIGSEGYSHFCTHFRADGGAGCPECSKCDLYKDENEEVVVNAAREKAEKEWWESEGRHLGDEKREEWEKQGVLRDMEAPATTQEKARRWIMGRA